MSKPEYFPKLDFFQLKRIANSFAQKYPAIEKFTLYPGVPPNFDYVVLAETTKIDDSKNSNYFAYKQVMNDWSFAPSESFINNNIFEFKSPQDDLCSIVRNAYKENHKDTKEKWLFLATWKDQNIIKLSEFFAGCGYALLIPGYHWDLFEKTSRSRKLGPNKKKSRPNQRHKIECRKVAAKLWEKHPNMTIADMINQNEIIEVSKKSDGALYMEKTVRNWIKDLCPNPAPGRRRRI